MSRIGVLPNRIGGIVADTAGAGDCLDLSADEALPCRGGATALNGLDRRLSDDPAHRLHTG